MSLGILCLEVRLPMAKDMLKGKTTAWGQKKRCWCECESWLQQTFNKRAQYLMPDTSTNSRYHLFYRHTQIDPHISYIHTKKKHRVPHRQCTHGTRTHSHIMHTQTHILIHTQPYTLIHTQTDTPDMTILISAGGPMRLYRQSRTCVASGTFAPAWWTRMGCIQNQNHTEIWEQLMQWIE